jgi:outer membrane protein assembly factor BamB
MPAYTMNADENELVVVGDAVVTVAHDPELVALDAATGAERWRYPVTDDGSGTVHGLSAADGVVYAGGPEGLDAISVADGTLLWRYEVDNPTSLNPQWGGFLDPAAVGGSVYGTTRVDPAEEVSSHTLVAVDGTTGIERWANPLLAERADPVASDGTTVVVVYETLEDDGLLWPSLGAYDAATGASLWVREIRDVERRPNTRPIIAGSVVVYGAQNGDVLAFHVTDGTRAWRRNVGYRSGVLSAARGTVFVNTGSEIHALQAKTGKPRWHKAPRSGYFLSGGTLPGEGTVPALVDGGPLVMYAASYEAPGQLYALDPRNGKQLWRSDAGLMGADSGSPIVAGGRIVLVLKSSESSDVVSFGLP